MNISPPDRPALAVIAGNRRALEEKLVRAIVYEPDKLLEYGQPLRPRGILKVVSSGAGAEPTPIE